jgi:hypothetical protein
MAFMIAAALISIAAAGQRLFLTNLALLLQYAFT